MKKILVIEDELSYSKLLQDQLVSNGYEVKVAQNGEEGLSMAKKQKPNLILLDIRMPKMDGMTMLGLLRKDESVKNTKVIVLTNLEPDEKIVSEVVNTEPTYYLVKSDTKLNDLLTKVKEVVEA